ncbi:UPF0223 family protein [Pseudalkalibacillus caeni]|uniref:UPF0223 family protein n=1 Tax=Exobacillus caeni TaxID=2574798 RepID=A0A5R9F255_9BACL|nr:UPF0223 family protein [Pseudalkalibacillus caeni]TLS37687.1 UPF0223 family protein [Pseudalkalibacillus caeni]
MNVNYPISMEWSKEEVIAVVNFFQSVEKANNEGIKANVLKENYQIFKQIVPSKSEEKQLCREFDKETGYSCYHTVKEAMTTDQQKVKIK